MVKYQRCCHVAAAKQLGPDSLACTQAGQQAGEGRELRERGGRDVQGWVFQKRQLKFLPDAGGCRGWASKSAPTQRRWASSHEGWGLTGSTPVLGQAGGGWGGCGKGELLALPARCQACRERGKPGRLVLKQGCPFILLYNCILISTNTPPSLGRCQRILYRLRLAC